MKNSISITIAFLMLLWGCKTAVEPSIRQVNSELPKEYANYTSGNGILKAHLKSGELVIFTNEWQTKPEQAIIWGKALHYDAQRKLIKEGLIEVRIDEVALFETNQPLKNRRYASIAALSITTAANVLLGVYCLYNPKACFGSCPTFYYQDDHSVHFSNAEGFSSSISPIMEKGDIDALGNPQQGPGQFIITMKNEALETHVINKTSLLYAPRLKGQRVLQTPDNLFYACNSSNSPVSAMAGSKDIIQAIGMHDQNEYFSSTHPTNLLLKETIEISFKNPGIKKELAFSLRFRQTQLTTFLFYSMLDFMGSEAPEVFAGIETKPEFLEHVTRPMRMLGGIDVEYYNEKSKKWIHIGSFNEAGPIAANHQAMIINASLTSSEFCKIRLHLTKGLWRIDDAALSIAVNQVTVKELKPHTALLNQQKEECIIENLCDDDSLYEVSFPGYNYQLYYEIPEGADDYELFLYSSGYYLEWMREEWKQSSDLISLKRFAIGDPLMWRKLAIEFKTIEPQAENLFWNSRMNP